MFPKTGIFQTSRAMALLALGLALALVGVGFASAEPDDEASAEGVRKVVVGKATISWHSVAVDKAAAAELSADFRQATKAHLEGGEVFVTAEPKSFTLPSGETMTRLPAEMIHTMFATAEGENYCSDSTVAVQASAVSNADGEGQ